MSFMVSFKDKVKSKGLVSTIAYYLSPANFRYHLNRIYKFFYLKMITFIDQKYFKERVERPFKKEFILHNVTWGRKYCDMLFGYCVPSLCQSGNLVALKNDGYEILFRLFVGQDDIDYARTTFKAEIERLEQFCRFEMVTLESMGLDTNSPDKGPLQQIPWVDSLRYANERGVKMFNLCADSVLGNWSLYNIAKAAEHKDVTISGHYARVDMKKVFDTDALKQIQEGGDLSNAELVQIALDCPHTYTSKSFAELDENMTYAAMSISQLNSNTYLVVHNQPSPFLLNPDERDIRYFSKREYNYIDKVWPRVKLKNSSMKLLSSSELFFILELTPDQEDMSKPGLKYNDVYKPRKLKNLWHYTNHSVVCTWKTPEV
jgi:hypothetical protein